MFSVEDMDKMSAYYTVLNRKLNDIVTRKMAILNKNSDNKDSNFLEKITDSVGNNITKNELSNISQAMNLINSMNLEIKNFDSYCDGFSDVVNFIKELPKLDDMGLANNTIENAFKKDFSSIKNDALKRISDTSSKVTYLLGNTANMSIYFGGPGEKDNSVRNAFPSTQSGITIGGISNNLFNLYSKKVKDYENIKSSKDELNFSSYELERIESYEQLYKEGKVEIQTRRKVFFIKENPNTLISSAKKAAVDKAHAMSVLSKLENFKFPKEFGYTKSTIDSIVREYKKKYNLAQKTLDEFDVDSKAQEVNRIKEEERYQKEEERKKEQIIRLGYELEKARKEGNSELVEQISSQISLMPYNETEKEFLISDGQRRYTEEENARKAELDAIKKQNQFANQLDKEEQKALYEQAKRELQMEGAFQDNFVDAGLDVRNTMTNEKMNMLIIERMEQIKSRGENSYMSMSTDELTVEYLKACGRIPESASLDDARRVADFNMIKYTINDKEEIIKEIQEMKSDNEKKVQRAYKLFKIEKSQYDALSAARREQMLKCVDMLQELDEDNVKTSYEFRQVESDIYSELSELNQSSGGMRL